MVSPPAVSIFFICPLALIVQGSHLAHTYSLEVLPQAWKIENTETPITLALACLYDRGSTPEEIRLEATTSAST